MVFNLSDAKLERQTHVLLDENGVLGDSMLLPEHLENLKLSIVHIDDGGDSGSLQIWGEPQHSTLVMVISC